MSNIKYRIENCTLQVLQIKSEYPSINFVSFKIEECNISEFKELAEHYGKEIEFSLGHGKFTIHVDDGTGNSIGIIELKTKQLILSQTFEEA